MPQTPRFRLVNVQEQPSDPTNLNGSNDRPTKVTKGAGHQLKNRSYNIGIATAERTFPHRRSNIYCSAHRSRRLRKTARRSIKNTLSGGARSIDAANARAFTSSAITRLASQFMDEMINCCRPIFDAKGFTSAPRSLRGHLFRRSHHATTPPFLLTAGR
jgi:hypothetical protein